MADVEECARLAIDCGLQVHRKLGPGLLESVYEAVLEASLIRMGVAVQRQKLIDIEYDGMLLREGSEPIFSSVALSSSK